MSKTDIENWVRCKGVTVSQTIFKIYFRVVCGRCERPFERRGRETMRVSNMDDRLAANCPHCGYWNLTDLVYTGAGV